MQFDSIINKRSISLAAAALSLGLAAFAISACDDPASSPSCTSPSNPDALIAITSPACGSSFKVGDSIRVKWTVKDDPEAPDAVDIQLSPDSGATWGYLKANSIPKAATNLWGNCAWAAQDSLLIGGVMKGLKGKQLQIRVRQYTNSDPKKNAVSGFITITSP
jgi:hypothetical protein